MPRKPSNTIKIDRRALLLVRKESKRSGVPISRLVSRLVIAALVPANVPEVPAEEKAVA